MTALGKLAEFAGRRFLAAIFLISGLGKIGQYAGTQGYRAAAGVTGSLLSLVIALEVAGALAVSSGWQTRLTPWRWRDSVSWRPCCSTPIFRSRFR